MTSMHFTVIKPFEFSRIDPGLLAGRNLLTAGDVALPAYVQQTSQRVYILSV